MSAKNRRSLVLINPKFQIAFLAYSICIAGMITAIFYGALYYFFWKFREMGANVGLAPNHVLFQFLSEQESAMNWCWLVVSFFALLLITVSGLYLSHRVAGPLYKLTRHMNSVAKGETTDEVKFRDKDFFLEIADAYNAQLHTLKSRSSGPV